MVLHVIVNVGCVHHIPCVDSWRTIEPNRSSVTAVSFGKYRETVENAWGKKPYSKESHDTEQLKLISLTFTSQSPWERSVIVSFLVSRSGCDRLMEET